MAAPTSPSIYIPAEKRLIYGIETAAAGTAVTTGLTLEPCMALTTTINRQMVDIREYFGVAADFVDFLEMNHYATIAVQVPLRESGFAAFCLAMILGNGSDSAAGATDVTHTCTPALGTTRMNTFTLYHDTGDTANVLQMTYATIESIRLTWGMTGVITADISLQARYPTTLAAGSVTIANRVGNTANYSKTRYQGFQTTFTMINSGNAAAYVVKPLSGDFTLMRTLEQIFVVNNGLSDTRNVFDLAPGTLDLSGSANLLYDGIAAQSVYADWLALQEQGVSAHQHSLLFSLASNKSIEIDFWPIKFSQFSLDESGTQVKSSISYQGYNDLSTAIASSGALTNPSKIVIKNQLTGLMSN